MTAPGESPLPPASPPPPRRRTVPVTPRPSGDGPRIVGTLFVVKGILTAVSALAVMAVLPWITTSLRTTAAETGANLPAAMAFTLDRPWILFAVALVAFVSGVLMAATRRGRIVHFLVSTVALTGLVLFLGLALMILIRSVAGVATGA